MLFLKDFRGGMGRIARDRFAPCRSLAMTEREAGRAMTGGGTAHAMKGESGFAMTGGESPLFPVIVERSDEAIPDAVTAVKFERRSLGNF